MNTSIIDQRTVIYNAYLMGFDKEDNAIFKSRDISKITDVDVVHVSALIMKCIKADLIRRAGREGRAQLYELTPRGVDRGEWLFYHYNPLTNEIYGE